MHISERIKDRLRQAHIHGIYLSDNERSELQEEFYERIQSIATASTYESAGTQLNDLGKFHSIVSLLSFKYAVDLSQSLNEFLRIYDRWDLPEIREEMFESIKAGKFR